MSTVMTMNQYVNQQSPEYMPIVRLDENEYEVMDTYTHRKGHAEEEERRIIKIKQYPDANYVQKGNDRQLYAMRPDDTCNNHSCFWLKPSTTI